MSHQLAFLSEQFTWVDNWTNNIIEDVPFSEWGLVEPMGSSLNWLMGHQVISKYFHAILSVLNADGIVVRDVSKELPVEDYFKYYFAGSDPRANWENRPSPEKLLEHWRLISAVCTEMIPLLNVEAIEQETEIRNPVARTKYEALTFTFKHQMWHNGQIATLKRLIKTV